MSSVRQPGGVRVRRRRRVLAVGSAAFLGGIVAVVLAMSGGGPPPLPLPGIGRAAPPGDPFGYRPDRASDFVARATVGSAHVLFTKSPGGALATAARVAALRGLIDRATAGTGVNPALLEGLVFVESAGRPDALVGGDPAHAAGLTQILASTGQTMLGMHIDLAASRRLTGAIFLASARGQTAKTRSLERRRAVVDNRFDPRQALSATVRYLQIARARFGRADLAIVAYHMGIGNLQQILDEYDGGGAVPYAQLYFDTAPDRHSQAYTRLSSLGDDSSLYYWRVLGAVQIMRLYRTDRAALVRLNALQSATDSAAQVLHPPDRTPGFADAAALYRAYARRALLRLPLNALALGLSYDPAMGAAAKRTGAVPALYRGLRVPALDMLVELAARVRALSGRDGSLVVASTVTDAAYDRAQGVEDPPAEAGWSFTLLRRYSSRAQAAALQAMLDRLQALNLIAWQRFPAAIEVTVASDASSVILRGP